MEVLQCVECHTLSGNAPRALRLAPRGLISSASYRNNCARCHGLEFDYRIEQPAPHDKPEVVRAAVRAALQTYIAAHPGDVSKPDDPRRLPLNFPRVPEPPARNADEWVARRADNAERLLWERCRTCHTAVSRGPGSDPSRPVTTSRVAPRLGSDPGRSVTTSALPAFAASNITTRWLTRATFDHSPHRMVRCGDCHAAERSQLTADVLMPNLATCATCHAPSRGAEARCFECHAYHDWSKSHAVTPAFTLTDFK